MIIQQIYADKVDYVKELHDDVKLLIKLEVNEVNAKQLLFMTISASVKDATALLQGEWKLIIIFKWAFIIKISNKGEMK